MENHKENLKSAKEWYKIAKEQHNQLAIEILEKKFPELAESDDERIRKELKSYFDSEISDYGNVEWRSGIYYGEVIAWFEKQKPTEWSEEDKEMLEGTIKLLDKLGGDRNSGYYTLHELDCREKADWLKSLKERLVTIC